MAILTVTTRTGVQVSIHGDYGHLKKRFDFLHNSPDLDERFMMSSDTAEYSILIGEIETIALEQVAGSYN